MIALTQRMAGQRLSDHLGDAERQGGRASGGKISAKLSGDCNDRRSRVRSANFVGHARARTFGHSNVDDHEICCTLGREFTRCDRTHAITGGREPLLEEPAH